MLDKQIRNHSTCDHQNISHVPESRDLTTLTVQGKQLSTCQLLEEILERIHLCQEQAWSENLGTLWSKMQFRIDECMDFPPDWKE